MPIPRSVLDEILAQQVDPRDFLNGGGHGVALGAGLRGPIHGPNAVTPDTMQLATPYDGPELGYAPVPESRPSFTDAALPHSNGILDMLGQSFADQPVPWHPVRGSSGTNMALGFLLSRAANMLGSQARQRNQNEAFVRQQNVLSDAERRAARRDELTARLAARAAVNREKERLGDQAFQRSLAEYNQGEATKRNNADNAAMAGRQQVGIDAKGAGAGQTDYSAEADAIESGERTMTDFSYKDRKGIQDWMTAHGQKATPPKVREARQIYEQATFAIDNLEELSKSINTASKLGDRAKQAAAANWAAMTRSETNTAPRQYLDAKAGLIPILSRLVGHVGVLTQKDVDSVMQMLPGFGEGPESAGQKWTRVRAFLAKKIDSAEKGYATKNAGTVAAPTTTTATPTVKIVNGQFVPVGK